MFRKPFYLRKGFDLLVCVTSLSLQLFRRHTGFHTCDDLDCLSCCCHGESMEAVVQEQGLGPALWPMARGKPAGISVPSKQRKRSNASTTPQPGGKRCCNKSRFNSIKWSLGEWVRMKVLNGHTWWNYSPGLIHAEPKVSHLRGRAGRQPQVTWTCLQGHSTKEQEEQSCAPGDLLASKKVLLFYLLPDPLGSRLLFWRRQVHRCCWSVFKYLSHQTLAHARVWTPALLLESTPSCRKSSCEYCNRLLSSTVDTAGKSWQVKETRVL